MDVRFRGAIRSRGEHRVGLVQIAADGRFGDWPGIPRIHERRCRGRQSAPAVCANPHTDRRTDHPRSDRVRESVRHVSESSHDDGHAQPNQRFRTPNRSLCEPILTLRRIHSPRTATPATLAVSVRANPHTMTDTQSPGPHPSHINRLHVSQSSHDDRHDAGRRGRRHHCHQAPTRHCAIDARITNEPKARSSTLSPVLPKHNNGSYGGFPPDDPIAPATTQDAQPHPPHSLRSRTRITA